MPPRIVANDKGIRDSAGDLLALLAACISTGINSARAATLFMNADKTAPRNPMDAMCKGSGRFALMTRLVSISIAPDCDSARDTISTSAIIMTAG